jgi:hypothetical protein
VAKLRAGQGLSTPGLYRVVAAGLVVAGLVAGAVAFGAVRERASLASGIVAVQLPLSQDAQELYRSLSDADATAADAFLANGVEPAALRQRYLDDVSRANRAVAVALREAEAEDTGSLQLLTDQISVYTGLVETARSYNRLGLPLGSAYLQEASGLMRQTLLPAAQQLFANAQRRLVGAQHDASGFPWLVLALGVLALLALAWAQVLLTRRTRRLMNVGLAVASLVVVISLAWSAAALGVAGGRIETGDREGSALVSLLAAARHSALQARADEALTLIARGSGAAFEDDFGAAFNGLVGADGRGGLLGRASAQAPSAADREVIDRARQQAGQWRSMHAQLRALDNGGDHQRAVDMATGSVAAVFGRLADAMSDALARTNDRVSRLASHGGRALTGLSAALVVLTGAAVAAVLLGFRPRLKEYR